MSEDESTTPPRAPKSTDLDQADTAAAEAEAAAADAAAAAAADAAAAEAAAAEAAAADAAEAEARTAAAAAEAEARTAAAAAAEAEARTAAAAEAEARTADAAAAAAEAEEVMFGEGVISRLKKKGLVEPDVRPHLNIVFIGHVDAGKSTTCGNILCLTGEVDSRTMEKYEKEAIDNGRESWYFAYVMDVNEEEREKGITTEVGRATFELKRRRFTILDAPGHKSFVPEMLAGASQADIGVLIVSARKGEFEAGFERGGQTQEHALLAKTLGVNYLIVAVNKMDEPSVDWAEARFRYIVDTFGPFLKSCGFAPGKDVDFVPISSLQTQNIDSRVSDPASPHYEPKASWWAKENRCLFELLEECSIPTRSDLAPLRIPLLTGYRDNGVVAVGKVESGVAIVDQPALLMPNNVKVKILAVKMGDDVEYAYAKGGENVELRLAGVDEDALRKGCVISSISRPCPVTDFLEVQLVLVEMLEHKPLLTAGYRAIFHAHTMSEECEVVSLIESLDKQTKKKTRKPAFARAAQVVTCRLKLDSTQALETFPDSPQLGRFTLRDEGKTIAIGKILRLKPAAK